MLSYKSELVRSKIMKRRWGMTVTTYRQTRVMVSTGQVSFIELRTGRNTDGTKKENNESGVRC